MRWLLGAPWAGNLTYFRGEPAAVPETVRLPTLVRGLTWATRGISGCLANAMRYGAILWLDVRISIGRDVGNSTGVINQSTDRKHAAKVNK